MLLASLLVCDACGGGADGPSAPTPRVDVRLPSNSVALVVGQSQALTAIVTGTANTGVAWSTSAPSIANVSGAGLVTALAAGNATVTATAIADPTRSATATVTVSPPVVVTLGASTLSLLQGATQQLTAAVTGTLNTSVSWSSSSTTVVTVSLSGLVSAVGAGTATITATSIADATKSASLSVTVTPVSFSIAPAAVALSVGGSQQLTATVNGTASTAVTYATSASTVATVSTTGVVTAVMAGSAAITVRLTSDPARSLTVPVTVVSAAGTLLTSGVPVTNISAAEDSVRLFRIFVPAGTTQLDLRTTGGTGDLDLYVARTAMLRNASDIVCASEGNGSAERCTIPNPAAGDWYVYLYAFEAFAGVTLSGTTSGGPAPTSGYTLSLTPPSITVERGASAQVTITAVREAGFSGTITLGTATLPSGVTATFSPATLGAGVSTATLTIAAGSAATIGSGPLTVTGASLGLTDRAATATLSVTAPSGGSNATPLTSGVPVAGISGAQGSQRLYRIRVPTGATRLRVTTSGGQGDVDLFVRKGSPPVSGSVDCESSNEANDESCDVANPSSADWYILLIGYAPYSGATLTATVTAGSTTPGGTFGFSLTASTSAVSMVPGTTASLTVSATRTGGFSGAIAITAEGLASGVNVTPVTIAAGATSATVTLSATSSAMSSAVTATLRGRATGVADVTIPISVTVRATAAQPSLITRSVGTGQGTMSPASGTYARGSVVAVYAQPQYFSAFKGWTSNSGCAGGIGACRLTFADRDILMEGRFEPIVWRTTLLNVGPYTNRLTSSGVSCTWAVNWTNVVIEIRYLRQLDGSYRGNLTMTGRKQGKGSGGSCRDTDVTVNQSHQFAATAPALNVRFVAYEGGGTEYFTLSTGNLNPGGPHDVVGATSVGGLQIEYTGAGRSGGTSIFVLVISNDG